MIDTRVSILSLVGLLLATVASAADTPLGPQPMVLLLRNGEVIDGQITRSGDRYDVAMPNAELRIRASEVRLVGRDRQELYRVRRENLELGKVQEHLELAEWCIKNRLWSEAQAELTDATEADATHPKIALLGRRLELAIRPPAAKVTPAATTPAVKSDQVSADELDKLVRSLPPGSVETFANSVQPLLLNHCSTAGCHGPQSQTSLRLMRIPPARVTGRRLTQRNLHAALSMIDRENPDESPLLLVPTQPHANLKAAIFTNRDAVQYKQLVDWVERVSGSAATVKSSKPATLTEPTSPLLQTVERPNRRQRQERGQAAQSESNAQEPANFEDSEAATMPVNDEESATNVAEDQGLSSDLPDAKSSSTAKSRGEYVPRPKLQRGAARDAFVPKDAFDPEIFNRRFFGK